MSQPKRPWPGQQRGNETIRVDKHLQAYDLRLKGWTIRNIAKELECSVGSVHGWLQNAMNERIAEAGEDLRKLELDRLDSYLQKVECALDQPDADLPKLLGTALRVGERRAKLLGLDAPERIDASVTQIGKDDVELMELLNEAKARQAREEDELRAQLIGSENEDNSA